MISYQEILAAARLNWPNSSLHFDVVDTPHGKRNFSISATWGHWHTRHSASSIEELQGWIETTKEREKI